MRVLVLTNHFAEFAGSEIVALEIAEWFRDRGDDVTLVANYIGRPLSACVTDGIVVSNAPEAICLSKFDLIWCQHDMLAHVPLRSFDRAVAEGRLPHIVSVSLSPYEPYENISGPTTHALSAEIFVNSRETRTNVARRARRVAAAPEIHVFHNAAPSAFWDVSVTPLHDSGGRLKSVAVISNHPPSEVMGALEEIARAGIATHCIGLGQDYHLVRPADLSAVDAIVTIGKSVPYAIAAAKPVYMYDRFGGDGWLTRGNFAVSLDHNFSGRPAQRRLSSGEIAREIVAGFAQADEEMRHIRTARTMRLLTLDHHLSALRGRAIMRTADPTGWLRQELKRPLFRARMMLSRSKRHVARRAFLASRTRNV